MTVPSRARQILVLGAPFVIAMGHRHKGNEKEAPAELLKVRIYFWLLHSRRFAIAPKEGANPTVAKPESARAFCASHLWCADGPRRATHHNHTLEVSRNSALTARGRIDIASSGDVFAMSSLR